MEKKLLREKGKLLLKAMDQHEKQSIESRLHEELLQSKQWAEAETVALTVSFSHEWDTYTIIEEAWSTGKQPVVPKCDPITKKMTFYKLKDFTQLETVYYGLKEPSPELTVPVSKDDIQLVIVPGLIYDRKGFRIGYGGGFYDRFLKDYNGVSLSILAKKQLVDEVPTESYDVPVHYLITENGLTDIHSSLNEG
ncbi:5-formyltetrahydrofolate cyclo-ligase [Halobacillus campisalis]|uniref:5-formyltetrahydrofolate cyclo-ligase n=1 Tax=Halobacillus campisalis TaxID=435909 RepID=A0ABW2K2H6_9BACI|nr:5-formyltetrahydrofolate cyclo-ligase [Halobacillus campisalis]